MNIYGVIGWPIKHSLSPAMHNAAFKELGISAEYKLFEVRPEGLEDFILNRKDVVGFNITVPHKIRAKEIVEKSKCLHFVQDQDYPVRMCGAINTIKRLNDGRMQWANTDVYGFRTSLKKDLKFDYRDKNVFLIGCGGAGRAVIAGLTWSMERPRARNIYIYEKNREAVIALRDYFSGWKYLENILRFISEEQIPDVIKNCQLLVNASPLGMTEGEASVIDSKLLHKELFVYDVIYNRETELIKHAKSLGLPAVNGLGMFLYQGAHAFEFWTGKRAPIEVMKKVLNSAIKN